VFSPRREPHNSFKRSQMGLGRMRCDMDAHLSDKASGRVTVKLWTYVLGAILGALAFLFAATVVFDAHEKSIEQRMLAEDVVQKLRQNAERERFRISMRREPEAVDGRPGQNGTE
jgi:hypothetical protein